MAIQSLDDLILGMSEETNGGFVAKSTIGVVANTYSSYYYIPGIQAGAGIAPGGSGQAYTGFAQGLIPIDGSVDGFVQMGGVFSSAGLFTLISQDRLTASAPLVLDITTPQTVTMPALPRYTTGDNVMIFGEVQTAGGATPCTITLSYTNQSGTSGRTSTFSYTSSWGANSMFNFPLQSGDYGVRSVESATCSVSTGTAGVWNIVLTKPLLLTGSNFVASGGSGDPIFRNGFQILPKDTTMFFTRHNATTLTAASEWYYMFHGVDNA